MRRYRIAGLTVASEFALPGAFEHLPDSAAPDILIVEAATPSALEAPTATGPTWALAGDRLLIAIPGVARFLLTEGRSIAVEPELGADTGDIAAFLTGSVLGILLHQRGLAVLHASAVAVGGRAVLFMGPSGAGKSTLAAALAKRGYPLVSDDLCVVAIDAAGRPLVHADGRLPKLWDNAIEHLALGGARGPAVRERIAKFYIEPPTAPYGAAPLPCGPIYALREARGAGQPGIQRPNVVDAALLLRQNAYRTRLIGELGQGELYFRLAAAIGNAGGVFRLARDLDFAALPALLDTLEAHWAERPEAAAAS